MKKIFVLTVLVLALVSCGTPYHYQRTFEPYGVAKTSSSVDTSFAKGEYRDSNIVFRVSLSKDIISYSVLNLTDTVIRVFEGSMSYVDEFDHSFQVKRIFENNGQVPSRSIYFNKAKVNCYTKAYNVAFDYVSGAHIEYRVKTGKKMCHTYRLKQKAHLENNMQHTLYIRFLVPVEIRGQIEYFCFFFVSEGVSIDKQREREEYLDQLRKKLF